MVRIWQHDNRTDDYKIILICVRKLMKNKSEIEAGKGPSFSVVEPFKISGACSVKLFRDFRDSVSA